MVDGAGRRARWASEQGKEASVADWAELVGPSLDGFRTAMSKIISAPKENIWKLKLCIKVSLQ